MSEHVHTWSRNTTTGRFTCPCGVQGHAPTIIAGQHRGAISGVVPYTCRARHDGRNCGDEAVHVTGDRQQSRCIKHTTPIAVTRTA